MWDVILQSTEPLIDLWQILGSLGSIILVVLTAYGTLILQNRSRVNMTRQRLFGAEGNNMDEGFVQDAGRRLDEMEAAQEQHARQTHTQLYKLDQKMDVVLEVVADEHPGMQVPRTVRDVEDVPPPPGNFYRGGGSPNSHTRGRGDGPQGSDD